MNKILFVAFAVVFALTSCSSSDDDGVGGPISTQIFGLIEKGPFVQGSEVTLTDLNKDLSQSGKSFSTNTSNDLGNFEFDQTLDLSSGLVELKTSGYFYNECTGSLSNSLLTLITTFVMTGCFSAGIVPLLSTGSADLQISSTVILFAIRSSSLLISVPK